MTKALLGGGLPRLKSMAKTGLHSYAYSRWDDGSWSLDVRFPGLKHTGKASLDGVLKSKVKYGHQSYVYIRFRWTDGFLD